MYKKTLWYFVIIISSLGFILMSAGFYRALRITNQDSISQVNEMPKSESPTAESSTSSVKDPNSLRIIVMGDSVAKGTGDEKAKGFSTYITDYFKNQTPKDIKLDNVGIDGLRSPGLLELLQSGKLNSLVTSSDFILVSIGGNDLRSIQSSKGLSKDDEFKEKLDSYTGNLKEILKLLRSNSRDAAIIFVGLYNPYEDGASYENTRFLNTWNYNTQQIIEEDKNAIFIPTYDIFKFNLKKYVAPDNLHPSSAGYQAMSNRIAKSVENLLNK